MDKPTGPTSHDVVSVVRRAIGERRVGHTGTLDPFASGLLVLLVGRATRLAQFLVEHTKSYRGVIRLGTTTDSCDSTGTVTSTNDAWTTLNEVHVTDAMTKLLGRQRHRPPAFSAKKVGGMRAYQLARRGEQPDIQEVDIEVFSFARTGWDSPNLQFETQVSSGTYVRALARDLGTDLGCGAHLAELRRTAVGPFSVDGALPPEEVSPAHIRPALEAVTHLRSLAVDGADLESLLHGRAITAPEPLSGSVALVAGDELVAVAEAEGTRLRPRVVFAS